MTVILQANMHRSRTAHDLISQIRFEKQADLVLISEQYRDGSAPLWFKDSLGTAAIWIPDPVRFHISAHGSGTGFVWVTSRDITYVSCYFTPNESIAEFQAKVDGVEDLVQSIDGHLLVAGDFNAKAVEWGETRTDSRGGRLLDFISRTGLVIMNTGSVPTFRRSGQRGTIIDLTLATENLAALVQEWQVVEDFTASDHQYITYRVHDIVPPRPTQHRGPPRWNVARMNVDTLSQALEQGSLEVRGNRSDLTPQERAELFVNSTMGLIQRACRSAVPRSCPNESRRPAYWWTDEIADLRRICLHSRRLAHRAARDTADAARKAAEYKTAKKELRRAIRISKRRCWKDLVEDLNRDPWGLGYKIVLRKLRAFNYNTPMEEDTIQPIVDTLFPEHPTVQRRPSPEGVEVPPFTMRELECAARSLRNRKAPGPDGLPVEVLKAVSQRCPELLLNMYNACLYAGVFPSRWKVAKLVLIHKGKGPIGTPSSYRPLCLLDSAGKLLEKLLRPRLQAAVEAAGGLSERQFGFRRGRSTIQAIQEVVDVARRTESGNHFSRPVCLLVTLDVKNAFNSIRWQDALNAMEREFRVPGYLLRIMGDYLNNRSILYDTADGQRTKSITAGAAQGSILGPDIWNYTYDGILRMELPKGAFLTGYADDIAAVIVARNVDVAQLRLNQVMRRVTLWLSEHGLQLALTKTEIVLLTKKRIPLIREMQVGDATVKTSTAVCYLGVSLDSRLSFWSDISRRSDKAAKVVMSLSRVMANIGGPLPCKRQLLLRTAESILLYGAEIWADALSVEKYRKRMAAVQRRAALRIACSYRTVSEPAVLVIAGVIPIDLLARERRFVHLHKGDMGKQEAFALARSRSIGDWQTRWDGELRGRWTHTLIPQIDAWLSRGHGEVDYYLTQLLTGHGHFRSFLYKIGKAESPACVYCESPSDSASHTFFECSMWTAERHLIREQYGALIPTTIVEIMMRDVDAWNSIARFVKVILRRKEIDLPRA